MKKLRTFLAMLMALVMVLSAAPTALMEGEPIEHRVDVYVDIIDQEAGTIVLGHTLTDEELALAGVTVTKDEENSEIDVTVPSVAVTDSTAAKVGSLAEGGSASLTVTDSAEVTMNGGWEYGVTVNTNDGGEAAFSAEGVTVVNNGEPNDGSGAWAVSVASSGGEASAEIGEDGVVMRGLTDAQGVRAQAWNEEALATADVKGTVDVSVTGGEATGAFARAEEGEAAVSAEGVTVTAEGAEDVWKTIEGADAEASQGGSASIVIGEDGVTVTSDRYTNGIAAYARSEADATVDVAGVVDITMTGGKYVNGVRMDGLSGDAAASAEGVIITGEVAEDEDNEINATGIFANAQGGGSITASIGEEGIDISGVYSATGVSASTQIGPSSATADVDGMVSISVTDGYVEGITVSADEGEAKATAEGLTITGEDGGNATGVGADAVNGGVASAIIGEDGVVISGISFVYGVSTYAEVYSSAKVEVDGGVEITASDFYAHGVRADAYGGEAAVSAEGVSITGESPIFATGVNANANQGGDASVFIGEDGVVLENVKTAMGVQVSASDSETTATAEVDGVVDLTVVDGISQAVRVEGKKGGEAEASVDGVIITGVGEGGGVEEFGAKGVGVSASEGGEASAVIGEEGIDISGVYSATGALAEAYDSSAKAEVKGAVNIAVENSSDRSDFTRGVRAVANGEEAEAEVSAQGVSITATASGDGWNDVTGAGASASKGGEASAVIGEGGVTVDGGKYATGIDAYASDEKSVSEITVNGDVDVTGEETRATGVSIHAYDGAEASVSVDGGVSAKLNNPVEPAWDDRETPWPVIYGAEIYARNGASASLFVNGDVTAAGYEGGLGLCVSSNDESEASAVVVGGVTSDARGVYAQAYNSSSTSAVILGDVTGVDSGLEVSSDSNGSVQVLVDGDVTGGFAGLNINGDSGAAAEVIINGAVSGESQGLRLHIGTWEEDGEGEWNFKPASTENVDLYAWKIENPGLSFGEAQDADIVKMYDDFYLNNVHYIIRYEDPENATLTLDGVQTYEWTDEENNAEPAFEYADENDKVTLNVELEQDYEVKGAYNGEERMALEKDANGNYFLIVPRGGGVYLTLDLGKIEKYLHVEAKVQASVAGGESGESEEETVVVEFSVVSTRTCVVAVDGVAEYWHYRVENGKVIVTTPDGLDIEIEEVDGKGILRYELPNGKIIELVFTARELARLKNGR